jgi:hypothetical protein
MTKKRKGPDLFEEHHIYPRSRLSDDLKIREEDINDIANLTWLLASTHRDNNIIGNREPNDYLNDPAILKDPDGIIRQAHFIPVRSNYPLTKEAYRCFLKARRELIKKGIKNYMDKLKSDAGF